MSSTNQLSKIDLQKKILIILQNRVKTAILQEFHDLCDFDATLLGFCMFLNLQWILINEGE